MFEKLVQKQAELEIENEERHKRMLEWEENKLVAIERKLDIEKRKNRDEKLKKETQNLKAKKKFKEWLKDSLIKQSYE